MCRAFGLAGAEQLAAEAHERALVRLDALPGAVTDLAAVTAYIRRRRR